ncbi:GLB1L [Cordylochernes scorpioides]|uniref:Beta-galactosidase n=1 Tax=Cordylochernes scorpioides TaxID=51811 RepID=A0ABY6K5B3_9ARAC|nr:GLB1L [Cordylochernes scorpioides]
MELPAAIFLCCLLLAPVVWSREFIFDPGCKCFLMDGEPFQYVSGSLHYFRVPPEYWQDRMAKMREMGLTVLETYVEWSSHEPEPGEVSFDAYGLDLFRFLSLAQEQDLLVILRPGPYICAERDFGGLPYWLLALHSNMTLRTKDPMYLQYVDRWFDILLPRIRPFLYENGGPIITVQVENEYGQIPACDFAYLTHLRDLFRKYLGESVPLFLTNIPHSNILRCDNIDNTLLTLDFGSGTNVTEAFSLVRSIKENTPLVVTEFYPGWLDHWAEPHANISTVKIAQTLEWILKTSASVSLYMVHGGTNFGFSSGANLPYKPQPTSYDYTAPISEAGDLTPRYFYLRHIIESYIHLSTRPLSKAVASPKLGLGPISLHPAASLFEWPQVLQVPASVYSKTPRSFESLRLAHGFCLYSTVVGFRSNDPAVLSIPGLADRAHVFVDRRPVGILSRGTNTFSMPLPSVLPGQTLQLLVENQGRINSAGNLTDFKKIGRDFVVMRGRIQMLNFGCVQGLGSSVTLDGRLLKGWDMQPLPMNQTTLQGETVPTQGLPTIFTGDFDLPDNVSPADTFLDTRGGWGKGVAYINDHALGRYWPLVGPQLTLYVPGVWLKQRGNRLLLVELERTPDGCWNNQGPCSMSLIKTPILDGPTPGSST